MLGVLIFVHELGHFLMARRIGVRVLTFSLGFGPKLLTFRRGDTEYCISAIPLGGYVKMAGENPEDARTGAADEFLSKTKWQRFQVLVMGPVMNLVLAVVVMAVVLYQGAQVPAFEQRAGRHRIVPEGLGRRKAAGLQPGDRIVSVDGKPVETWEAVLDGDRPARPSAQVTVGRSCATASRSSCTWCPPAQGKFEIGDIGVLPVMHPEVVAVEQGHARRRSGPAARRRHPRRRRRARRLEHAAHRVDQGARGQAAAARRSSAAARSAG